MSDANIKVWDGSEMLKATLRRWDGSKFIPDQPYLPYRLFQNGEEGIWLDPSDLDTLFQDSLGTTPVTAPGQPVGLVLDKSGNDYHATQPVASQRPTYGIVPKGGRRNLLTHTEEMDNTSIWDRGGGASGISATPSPEPDVFGGSRAFQANQLTSDSSYLFPEVEVGTGPYTLSLWVKGVGPSIGSRIRYWIWTVGGSEGTSLQAIHTLTDEWVHITQTGTFTKGGKPRFRFDTGDGVDNIGEGNHYLVCLPQAEKGTEATAYQRVGNEYDVTEEGVPSIHYLSQDMVDDNLDIDFGKPFEGTVVQGTLQSVTRYQINVPDGKWQLSPDPLSPLDDGTTVSLIAVEGVMSDDDFDKVKAFMQKKGAGL